MHMEAGDDNYFAPHSLFAAISLLNSQYCETSSQIHGKCVYDGLNLKKT